MATLTNNSITTATLTNNAIMPITSGQTFDDTNPFTFAEEGGTFAQPIGIRNNSITTATITNNAITP